MKYYRPVLSVPTHLDPSFVSVERLGGRPWGLTDRNWPRCKQCGGRQSLLAQLLHHPKRLNLGGEGRMLLVFQCNNGTRLCETWDGNLGTNACFVLERRELVGGPSDSPPGELEPHEHALVISSRIESDDGIEEAEWPKFFSFVEHEALPRSTRDKVTPGTRLGSVPYWIQNADEGPADGWRFVGQLESDYDFLIPPQFPEPWIYEDAERSDGRTHFAEGPNFGDAGIGYIFLKEGKARPDGWFFWQCA